MKPRKLPVEAGPPLCKKKLHTLDGDNLKIGSRGERICIACRAAYMKTYMRQYWKQRPDLRYGDVYKTSLRDRVTKV